MTPRRLRVLVPLVALALPALAAQAPAGAAPVAPVAAPASPAAPTAAAPVVVGDPLPGIQVETRLADVPDGPVAAADRPAADAPPVVTPPVTASLNTSTFQVNYSGFSPQAQVAFQKAVDVWATKLTSAVPITVNATYMPLQAGVLGSAGPTNFYQVSSGPFSADTYYPAALANKLTGSDNSTSQADITATFSSTANFYYGLDGQTPAGQVDFSSVVMHELGHGIGFVSSGVASGGTYGMGFGQSAYTPLDRMLRTGAGSSITGLASGPLGTAMTSNDLWATGPFIAAATGSRVRMYAPASFESGSSLSHLNESTFPSTSGESLMTPAIGAGEYIAQPGPITMAVFHDMGWSSTSIAGTVTNPNATPVPGVVVELWAQNGTSATATATTATNGTYSFGATTNGTWNLRFTDPLDRFATTWLGGAATAGLSTPLTMTTGARLTADHTMAWPSTSAFTAVTPTRLLDTRVGPVPSGRTINSKLGVDSSLNLVVAGGTTAIPSTATAVVLTVTSTEATAPSYIAAWPTGQTMPVASSLNPAPGVNTPNLVTVKVGTGGQISLYNSAGTVHLIADIVGYYSLTAGDGFAAMASTRVLDTRFGPVPTGRTVGAKLGPNSSLDVSIAGFASIPSTATGVVLNITAASASAGSFLAAWPAGQAMPLSSAANPAPGMVTANLVMVKLGTSGAGTGKVSIYNAAGDLDVIADVVGWFGPTATSRFVPRTPYRVLDTRTGTSPAPVAAGGTISQTVADDLIAPSDATGAVLNLTSTSVSANSYITTWPAGVTRPLASSLNPQRSMTIANLATVKLGSGASLGRVSLYNDQGTVHLIADLTGYYRG